MFALHVLMYRAEREMKGAWKIFLVIFTLVCPASSSFVHPYCTESCTGLPTGQYGDCYTCDLFVYCDHGKQRQASCPKEYGPTFYDWSIGVCAHYQGSAPCPSDWKPAPRASGSSKSGVSEGKVASLPGTSETASDTMTSGVAGGRNQAKSTSQARGNETSLTGSANWRQQPASSGTRDPQPPARTTATTTVPRSKPETTTMTPSARASSTTSVPTTTTEPSTTSRTTATLAVTTAAVTPPTSTTTTTTATTKGAAATPTASAKSSTSGEGGVPRATAQKSCGTPCQPQCPPGPKAQVYVRCGDCCYIVCSPEGALMKEACPHPSAHPSSRQ